jgi:hypothetical protein
VIQSFERYTLKDGIIGRASLENEKDLLGKPIILNFKMFE